MVFGTRPKARNILSSHDMKTSFLNSFSNRTWRYTWVYVDMCVLHKLSFAPSTFVIYCSESPAEIKCVSYGKPPERTRC